MKVKQLGRLICRNSGDLWRSNVVYKELNTLLKMAGVFFIMHETPGHSDHTRVPEVVCCMLRRVQERLFVCLFACLHMRMDLTTDQRATFIHSRNFYKPDRVAVESAKFGVPGNRHSAVVILSLVSCGYWPSQRVGREMALSREGSSRLRTCA